MADPSLSMEEVEKKKAEWAEARRRVIERLRAIAAELDGWHIGDHAATIAGSSVGIIGGSLMLGGLAFPPLLIPGLVMTLVGAGGKIGTSVARIAVVKNLAAEAQQLCEEDANRLASFVEGAEALLAARAAVGAAAAAMNALKASIHVLRHTFITVPNAAGRASLKALLPAAAVGPIRALAGVTAGIGMAFDLVSLISSATSLASNQTDEMATKLREIATQLEQELNDVTVAKADNDQQ